MLRRRGMHRRGNGDLILAAGGTIDTDGPGTLAIGGANQTGLTIGRVGINTTVSSPLSASGQLICGGSIIVNTYQEIKEMVAPAAPSADRARLFLQDNGAGKTQLMVLFATGVAIQLAIQV